MSSIILKTNPRPRWSSREKKNWKEQVDTIAAISTPPGQSGIGIVRISGRNSLKIANKIFKGKTIPSRMKSHTVCFGKIIDVQSKQMLDQALITVMLAPNSYTCEDVVEINCHGGELVLSKVLEQTLKCGARLAQPGEFTLRAFLNGRIDLAQAEAVADIIKAKTESGLKVALQNLEGDLSEELNRCRDKLIDILAEIEREIDFVEEDIEELDRKTVAQKITQAERFIKNLLNTYFEGRILKDGLNAVIVGSPNVGKSSLLNALLGQDRAIVTAIPGTTRDIIAEYVNIKGIPVRLVDTAGFRISKNTIELEGIKRAKTEINKADLIIWTIDASKKLSRDEKKLHNLISKYKFVIVLNKIDIVLSKNIKELKVNFKNQSILEVSALKAIGIKKLKSFIVSSFILKNKLTESVIISNLRHKELLKKSLDGLQKSKKALLENMSPEFVAIDLRMALDQLGQIIGKVITDDILNRIFSKFCVGK